uniref:Uncharacterized protein n=1 Tax=Arion vulgaris TaxID=1028688 RepID=A0A0B6ZA91_9EUPU
MTLRDTVSKWHAAMCLLEDNMFTEATQKLLEIQKPSARILSNLGCICMLQQRYEDAIQYFNASIEQDQYLAVALYQRGICYHKLQRYDKAINDFRNARSMLRSEGIDYKQLGAEILLTPQLLDQCITIIEDNLNKRDLDKLQTYSVLDCIFRPPITVVDNLVKHNFLGNATVISSTEEKYIVAAPERRQLPQSKMRFPNQTSLSVPSSPASSRIHQTTSNSGRTYISPPKRPPPRLLPDGSKMHQKSRSLEDVSSYAIVSEIIDESTSSVSRTAQTKPKPIYDKISSPTTFKPKLGLSPAITLNQPYINESDSKISLACHTKNLAIIIQPASHASVGELSTNLDKQMSRLENNPGKQIPLRSPIVELGQGSYVGQEENVDSNPGYLLGHAARMRSVFESIRNVCQKQINLK